MIFEPLKIQYDLVSWLSLAGDRIRQSMLGPIQVSTKSGPNDLVTNIDRQIEQFYVQQIRAAYPEAQICGEEGFGDRISDLHGLVFFVDPIDGTMNFVRQRQNFATMIGVFLDGQPLVGAIADVMRSELIVGGPQIGVQFNGRPITLPDQQTLADGLLGVNALMYAHDRYQLQALAAQTSGVRVIGSAGLEFMSLITNQQIGYISALSPWDVAAGWAIGSALGLEVHNLAGTTPALRQREVIVAGIPAIWPAFKKLQN
ncbi:inositol monophosphatase family protein [Lapidilactobacillus achengensis]|uniref:Inositol monophosphatase family protein n=1 Tax=Lapidilactobacillus achengensis TaxID=2486000 RepID=A0ABW1URP2_9LACO|nr:inositol monophosphatase family protein [Lapidilactobacillus achengensis]